MGGKRALILTEKQITQKVNRLAMEIYERNYLEKEIILAGVAENGHEFAEMLTDVLKRTASFKVQLVKLTVNKKDPIGKKVVLGMDEKKAKGKVVIIVDDVLNSGKTLMYGLKPFLSVDVKKLNIAVLVNRSHQQYPMKADYVGLSLSTTLKEHISVEFGKKGGVYLE